MSDVPFLTRLFGSRRNVKAANAARDIGNWDDATHYYTRHVEAHPNDAAIWMQLGHAYKEQGTLKDAEAAYAKALLLEPDNADTHIMMGHLKKQAGNLRQAAAHYDDAVNLVPNSLDARIQIAFTEKDLGNTEAALNHYKVINQLDPTNEEVSGLIKQLSGQLRRQVSSGGAQSGQGTGAGQEERTVQRLETTVRAMASEIHRLRGIIDEIETRFLESENAQLQAYQGLKQEVHRIEKKQIEAKDPGPLVSGRFDELLAQLSNAQRELSGGNASDKS